MNIMQIYKYKFFVLTIATLLFFSSPYAFSQSTSTAKAKQASAEPQVTPPKDANSLTVEQMKQLEEQYKKMSPEQKKRLKIESLKSNVEESLKILKEKVLKKGNEDLYGTEIKIYSQDFLSYNKSPYIEEATKIYKEWYKKIGECLAIMSEVKFKHRLAQLSKAQDSVENYEKEFSALQEKLEKILKNPPRISTKKKN